MINEADPLIILQTLLDLISAEPGAILYRDKDRWRALLPGAIGQVLTLNDVLMPSWQDLS